METSNSKTVLRQVQELARLIDELQEDLTEKPRKSWDDDCSGKTVEIAFSESNYPRYVLASKSTQDVLDLNWGELSFMIDAISHPARLSILKAVLSGITSTRKLVEQDFLATTGKFHHHLRQLVAAGWLESPSRGQYLVPDGRAARLLALVLVLNSLD